jgi:small-conductance mechanosensitive channel
VESLNKVLAFVQPSLAMFAVLLLGVLMLFWVRRFLNRRYEGQADRSMKIQLIMLILSFALLIAVIIVSPLTDSQQGQLLSLLGLLMSASIALSSSSFVGNAMAGVMLRVVRSFQLGDFVRVGDHFGRVSERGLFHIEIQTEDRDLTTLPSLLLVTNPVKVIRSLGTLIAA